MFGGYTLQGMFLVRSARALLNEAFTYSGAGEGCVDLAGDLVALVKDVLHIHVNELRSPNRFF